MDIVKLKNFLKNELELVDKSVEVLLYSLNKARKIGVKDEYLMDELEVFESLCSRFSRTSDILTQKILKTMFIIMQEDAPSFIDKCNLCEKFEIIDKAETLYAIRKLRNEIAHEYSVINITDLFKNVIEYSEDLINVIKKVKKFITDKELIDGKGY